MAKEKRLSAGDYVEDPRNTRRRGKRAEASIRKSIETFGAGRSIVVDAAGQTIGGAGVLKQAQALGLKVREIESDGSELIVVRRTDLAPDDPRRHGLAVADNRTATLSEDDEDALRAILADVEASAAKIDWAAMGYTAAEAGRLLADGDFGDPDGQVEAPPKQAIAQAGRLYRMGPHALAVGSSTDLEFVMAAMKAHGYRERVDLLLTDPPYGVSYEIKSKGAVNGRGRPRGYGSNHRESSTVTNDDLKGEALRDFLVAAFSNAAAVMRPGACFYAFHPIGPDNYWFQIAIRASGLELHQTIVWRKNQMILGRGDYQPEHEPVMYGWKPGASHLWTNDRKQTTVIHWPKPHRSLAHPTIKPLGLLEYLLRNNTMKGDLVFDGFAGSGSTMMAADAAERVCLTIELDPAYADVVINRYAAAHEVDREVIYANAETI